MEFIDNEAFAIPDEKEEESLPEGDEDLESTESEDSEADDAAPVAPAPNPGVAPGQPEDKRFRHFAFTIFAVPAIANDDKAAQAYGTAVAELLKGIKSTFVVFQVELGKQKGGHARLHAQGTISFPHPHTWNAVRKLQPFPGTALTKAAHIEIVRDLPASIRYCCKDSTRIAGPFYLPDRETVMAYEKQRQGKRSDLADAADMLMQGASKRQVALVHPTSFIRYHNGMSRFAALMQPLVALRKVDVYCFYGGTGTGKTTFFWNPYLHRDANGRQLVASDIKQSVTPPSRHSSEVFVIQEQSSSVWFSNYEPHHTTLLLDDVNWRTIPITHLLRWLDTRPVDVPTKGFHARACWTKVFIISNQPPKDWYPFAPPPQQKAVLRRLRCICRVDRVANVTTFVFEKGSRQDLPADWR